MSPELQAQLAEMASKLNAMTAHINGGAPPNGGGPGGGMPAWLTPPGQMTSLPTPIGWSVGIEIPVHGPHGDGTVTLDMAFPAETFPQAQQIVQALIGQGYRVYVRMPKQPGFGGNGGGYPPRNGWGGSGGGGGWNGGGGGYGRWGR